MSQAYEKGAASVQPVHLRRACVQMQHFVVTGEWHTCKRRLQDHIKMPTKISATAFANEEYPVTNTSPVPASIIAAPVSEAVTDVFQANSIRASQVLTVSVPIQQGRKTVRKKYGAVVLQVQEDDLEVRYLHQKDGKYYFPDTEDDAWNVRADIVRHLDIAQMASRVFH